MLLAAAVIGIAATYAAHGYVKQAAARAVAGQQAVTVMVAARAIPAGTAASTAERGGALRAEQFPAAAVPPGAVRSVTAKLGGLVTSHAVPSGEILLRASLVQAARTTSGLNVPPGMVVVTVQFCLAQAVAGYVRSGSQVAVFGITGTGAAPSCGSPHLDGARTRLVLPRVQVLAAGPAPALAAPAQGISSAQQVQATLLLTLAVTRAQAAELIALTARGMPYLALLTPDSQASVTANPGGG
jgi:pilus assembly protein CpaB